MPLGMMALFGTSYPGGNSFTRHISTESSVISIESMDQQGKFTQRLVINVMHNDAFHVRIVHHLNSVVWAGTQRSHDAD